MYSNRILFNADRSRTIADIVQKIIISLHPQNDDRYNITQLCTHYNHETQTLNHFLR